MNISCNILGTMYHSLAAVAYFVSLLSAGSHVLGFSRLRLDPMRIFWLSLNLWDPGFHHPGLLYIRQLTVCRRNCLCSVGTFCQVRISYCIWIYIHKVVLIWSTYALLVWRINLTTRKTGFLMCMRFHSNVFGQTDTSFLWYFRLVTGM
jgi:hypothetical protein